MYRKVFSHGFISCHLLGKPNQWLCLLPPAPPTTDHPFWKLSPQAPTPIKPCDDYYFSHLHKRCRPHTSYFLVIVSHLSLFSTIAHLPLSSVMDRSFFFFLGPGLPSCILFSFRVTGLSHVALLTLFVLSAAKRERPEQNARLLLAASTSPSGPPSAPTHARL